MGATEREQRRIDLIVYSHLNPKLKPSIDTFSFPPAA
jgi:hypothetical protein